MRVCIFDLDHTLVRSPLDLTAMALDMRGHLERTHGALPARPERYRVGELIAHCQRQAPALETELWSIALDHERRALAAAVLEPGALEAVGGARAAGFTTALWTNNAREITAVVLDRFGLLDHLDLVVTRDDMRALKPDPDGWHVIAAALGPAPAVVVGDSWVDGLAAAAAGLPFVAYRANPADLARWNVTPLAALTDLEALPAWLAQWQGERIGG
ncbi:MAG: HAD-IA family hydrolase [Candidatus Rokubacteria bacterium]|nr:HAD-IA family hydrolase [Candidatus Rokubacteria bacterium]